MAQASAAVPLSVCVSLAAVTVFVAVVLVMNENVRIATTQLRADVEALEVVVSQTTRVQELYKNQSMELLARVGVAEADVAALAQNVSDLETAVTETHDALHLLSEDFMDFVADSANTTTILQEYDVTLTGGGDFAGGVPVKAALVRVRLDAVRGLHFMCIMPTNTSYVVLPAGGVSNLVLFQWSPALSLDGYNLFGQSIATTSDKWDISSGVRIARHQFNDYYNTFIFLPETTLTAGTTVDITAKLNLFLNVF